MVWVLILLEDESKFPERPETAMEDMREVGPTFMLGAPRLWEQIAADMRSRILDAPK